MNATETAVDSHDIECVIDRAERDIQTQETESDVENDAECEAAFKNLDRCRPLMLAAPDLLEMVEILSARVEAMLRLRGFNDPTIDRVVSSHPELQAARRLIARATT